MASKSPAPGALDLVRRFVNTLNVEAGEDRLGDPASLRIWLEGEGLPAPGEPTPADVRHVQEVREALRELLMANAGGGFSADAPKVLNKTARRAPLVVHFESDGSSKLLPEADAVDAALGRILAAVAGAMMQGTWSRLKACREDTCQWAFYDHTRNRSGVWCDMAVCGNRTKVRAYRRRHGA